MIDGFGVATANSRNPIAQAKTPNLDKYAKDYPYGLLHASGEYVGRPKGSPGDDEVGYNTIGAGRVLNQEYLRIKNSIASGSFFQHNFFKETFEHAKYHDSNIHIIGLVGSGKSRSATEFAFSLFEVMKNHDVNGNKVIFHAITDGIDSDPEESAHALQQIETQLNRTIEGNLSTIIGRSYAMDNTKNWKRTKLAYDLYIHGKGTKIKNWKDKLDKFYKKGISDNYIPALILEEQGETLPNISKHDVVIFLNFKGEEMFQLVKMFQDEDFSDIKRDYIEDLLILGFGEYRKDYPPNVLYQNEEIDKTLNKILYNNQKYQLKIAETEKFMNLTQYLNDGDETILPGEDRIEIKSKHDIKNYNKRFKMQTDLLVDKLMEKLDTHEFDFIITTLANLDLVAHTGDFDATVKAMEYIDKIVGQIVEKVNEINGLVIITSSHGNAEELYNKDGDINTTNSTNPVPIYIIHKFLSPKKIKGGTLADIAPTILALMQIPVPAEMTGEILL